MTGTQIHYYFLCQRKLWLFAHNVLMEQNSDTVALGKHISETTYTRIQHEIHIPAEDGDIVIDFYDAKSKIIHEVKKSDKMEETHIWQVKHYINQLEKKGIQGVSGEIDYPKLKQKIQVELSDFDREELAKIKYEINTIIKSENLPEVINKPFCKNCSYYDLCYV